MIIIIGLIIGLPLIVIVRSETQARPIKNSIGVARESSPTGRQSQSQLITIIICSLHRYINLTNLLLASCLVCFSDNSPTIWRPFNGWLTLPNVSGSLPARFEPQSTLRTAKAALLIAGQTEQKKKNTTTTRHERPYLTFGQLEGLAAASGLDAHPKASRLTCVLLAASAHRLPLGLLSGRVRASPFAPVDVFVCFRLRLRSFGLVVWFGVVVWVACNCNCACCCS